MNDEVKEVEVKSESETPSMDNDKKFNEFIKSYDDKFKMLENKLLSTIIDNLNKVNKQVEPKPETKKELKDF